MTQASVNAVRSVDLAVRDLDLARSFFTDVWHLQEVASDNGTIYLRATDRYFHVISLRSASPQEAGLVRIVLQADSRQAVDLIFEQVGRFGTAIDGAPRSLHGPGGGYGFGFKDPEERNFAVVCEVDDHPESGAQVDRPTRLSHVNLNCRENDATFGFLSAALGFKLSDQTRQFRFIRCNADHHSLVLGFNDNANLNHIAFEMPDLDSVMRGIGRMRDHGYPVEWGPGRHGPGNNVFAYFCGPGELPIEYTGEMQQVDDSYAVGKPEDWTWPPGRLDHWGITPGPSARVKAAQALFRFTESGYRLERD
ncbi:MAG: VOC family protein [Pseudorhodoplanes sp.]|uniref:VOC family protein n=1 Tax=Pseudorhodoplanes sp. TaxID=1934341 RepID=UPI003D0C4B6A